MRWARLFCFGEKENGHMSGPDDPLSGEPWTRFGPVLQP